MARRAARSRLGPGPGAVREGDGDPGRGGDAHSEKATLRWMTIRATALTTKVRMNRTSPAAMKAPVFWAESNSPALLAIRDAKVSPPLNKDHDQGVPGASEDTMKVTAMVSPRARPRASIAALMTPGFPKGGTAVRTVSQVVAPSASAASRWLVGVCAKTSRDSAVTMAGP